MRHFEVPWYQVRVLFIADACADRVFSLAEEGGHLLDEQDARQLTLCSCQRFFEHFSSFTDHQRRGRRTSRDARATRKGSVKEMPRGRGVAMRLERDDACGWLAFVMLYVRRQRLREE